MDAIRSAPPASLGGPLHPSPPSALEEVGAICRRFRLDALRPQLDACTALLQDGEVVNVAVVGRFKAGKSSFLNSVVGGDLLPVAALPLTAVITRLRYGASDRSVVKHLDGTEREIPVDDLREYVTEQRNPANTKAVAMVEVELSSLRPYQGIRFVDTPGLGSVFTHNTRASMDWLPRIGAALLAISADQPLSEHDMTLLAELAKHTPEISILLTKADLVSSGELADIIRFIRDQVGSTIPGAVRVLPFSVRPGFEPQRAGVREYLLGRVAEHHEETSRSILRYKLQRLTADCRQYLEVALAAASAAAEARTRLQEALRRERTQLEAVGNEIRIVAQDLKGRLMADALERYVAHTRELVASLTAGLRAAMPGWRGDLRKTAEQFAQWTYEAIEEQLGPHSHQHGEELIARHLTSAQASLSRVVQAFQDRLAQAVAEALHTPFAGARFDAAVRSPERPDVRVSRVFDIPFEILWFLIPMTVFRPLVNRHFVRRLPWEVEKNLHRLAMQWAQAIGASIDDLARQAREFMWEELATIDRLVSESQDQRPALEGALATLEAVGRAGEEQ